MQAEMYEITPCPQGRLATMPRPRGGDWLRAELASLKMRGVTDLVSALTPAEETELNLQAEEQLCAELELKFHRHPIGDHGLPVQPGFDEFITSLAPVLTQRHGFIAIHCFAGIGRATVIAAALLCRLGVSAEQALARISQARGFEVPDTQEQYDFIHNLEQRKS
jgi:protein-tyrosine phosphatase